MRRWYGLLTVASVCLGVVALASDPRAACQTKQDIKVKTKPAIEVTLRFSVMELDPLQPGKSFVECVVRNHSEKAVRVPTVYTGNYEGDMFLSAKDQWPLTLIAWAGPKKQVTKILKPSEALTIFKADLKDVLLLEMDKNKPLMPGERRWYWSWSA